MAKPKTSLRRVPKTPASNSTPAPPPDLGKAVTRITWPKGQVIRRVHLDLYHAAQFNPGIGGNARFSPIKDATGSSIPTLYGGVTFECAAMETVFHDVPFAVGLKTYDKAKLIGQISSQVLPTRDLVLADLSSTALRKLGVGRSQLIDTEKDRYPQTRVWAEAIHARCPDVDGLCWVSRQDDRARALVLFGDRVQSTDLAPNGSSITIASDPAVYTSLLELADRIGVKIIGGTI
jgi:RES domain